MNPRSQSEERRDLKMRDFKNAKVILLRDLKNLSGGEVCTKKAICLYFGCET